MSRSDGLRILMVCPDYKPNVGGEAELAFGLARGLERAGHAVTVLAPDHHDAAPEDAELRGPVVRALGLESFRPLTNVNGWLAWPAAMIGMLRTVRGVARDASADVCLVTTYMTWPTLAVRGSGLPYAFFLHGEEVSLSESRGGLAHRLFLDACRSARRIFFNSDYSRGLLLRHLPGLAATTEAVGCGVRTDVRWTAARREEARRALGWGAGPVLLTIANLYRKKGIQTVIRALPDLGDRHPGLRYVVVGEGPYGEDLRTLARAEGVAGRVVFRGRVERETKERLFAASDLYVMVSQPGGHGEEEGFGITFLEAAVHGLPVVGSRCGGIPEAVAHGRSGLLVEPGRPDRVTEAVSRLLDDPDLRRELVRGGRQRIEEELNWTSIAGRVGAALARGAGGTS